jgi:mono/diheme cytochrome c family protein
VREARRPAKLEQRIVEALNVVDRCESCHDLATHPGQALVDHSVERFGCTPCHGGQGLATDKNTAHRAQPDWERPLYTRVEREAACGGCHQDVPAGLERLARGRKALAERGCSGCHEIPGVGAPDMAPALDGLAAKLQPAWVRAWLNDPAVLNDQHAMPRFTLSAEQIEALVAFLFSTERPKLEPLPSGNKGDADRGRTAVATRRCATCHRIGGRGGTLGPPLDMAGAKLDPTWLYNYLLDVHRLRPTSRMPGFRLPPAEAADIVTYVTEELVPDTAERPWAKHGGAPDPALAGRGRELFTELGCRGCHGLAGVRASRASVSLAGWGERRIGDLLATASGERLPDIPSWVARKVIEPRAFEVAGAARSAMPAYKITPEEALDIGVAIGALRARPVPAAYVRASARHGEDRLPTGATRQLVERFRCLVCHRIGDLGGNVSKVPLDGAASRLNRPWLDEFLREPLTVRMGQAERMPALGMEAADATRLANWIETSLADERIVEQALPTAEEVTTGKQLYRKGGCAACHVAEGEGEIKAPVLDGANKRLKLAYVVAVLESGPTFVPEGRHPPDVYPRAEARALAAYVMSLAPPAVEKAGEQPAPKH